MFSLQGRGRLDAALGEEGGGAAAEVGRGVGVVDDGDGEARAELEFDTGDDGLADPVAAGHGGA